MNLEYYKIDFQLQLDKMERLINDPDFGDVAKWFLNTEVNHYSFLDENLADKLYESITYLNDFLRKLSNEVIYGFENYCLPVTEKGKQLLCDIPYWEYEELHGKPLYYASSIYECIENIEKLHERSVRFEYVMLAVQQGTEKALKYIKETYKNIDSDSFKTDVLLIASISNQTHIRNRLKESKLLDKPKD